MKVRFCVLFLMAAVLLGGCAERLPAEVPEESISASSVEKLPADSMREDALPERKPLNEQKDTANQKEETLTEEEKTQLRFERGVKFSLDGDEGSFVGSAVYVHVADGAPLRRYDGQKEMQEDGLELWTFSSYDSEVERNKKGFVLVMKDDVPQDAFYYSRGDCYCAEWAEMGGEEPPEGLIRSCRKWDAATQTYTRFFDRSDFEMTIDLAAREVRGEYKLQAGNLHTVLVHSPCGRYDICEMGRISVGDSSSSSIVLRDNATGQFRWLSGRRSRFSDYGFFANGDLYVREPDCLRMFYKENGYTEQAPFELPLGAQPEGFTRYLSAVRRDPVDGTYLVVYYEETDRQAADRWMNPFETDVCFMIGKCDQNGRLLQSWNSGQMVVSPLYDTTWVDLWLQDGDAYVNAYQKTIQSPVVSFSFDFDSETFTSLYDPRSDTGKEADPFKMGPVYPLYGTVQAAWSTFRGVCVRENEQAESKEWWDNASAVRSGGSIAVLAQAGSPEMEIKGLGCVALLSHADGTEACVWSAESFFPEHNWESYEKKPDALDSTWLDAGVKKLFYACEHENVLITVDFNAETITSQPYTR